MHCCLCFFWFGFSYALSTPTLLFTSREKMQLMVIGCTHLPFPARDSWTLVQLSRDINKQTSKNKRVSEIHHTRKNKEEERMGQTPCNGDGHTRAPAATNWPIRFIVLFPFNSSLFFSLTLFAFCVFLREPHGRDKAQVRREMKVRREEGDDILDIIGHLHLLLLFCLLSLPCVQQE
jgi:hypothetical protein